MKNFNIASFKYMRKLIGFISILVIDYYIFDKFNTDFKVLLFLLLNAAFFYFIMEFASFGGDNYFTLDFRSEYEKEIDEQKQRQDLIKDAVNNLLIEASMGGISENEVDRRLKIIEKISVYTESQPLLVEPKNNEYV